VTLPDRARRDFGLIGGRINETPKNIIINIGECKCNLYFM
jgi:hypothetical protein